MAAWRFKASPAARKKPMPTLERAGKLDKIGISTEVTRSNSATSWGIL
jgi:hypothetical protein